MKQGALHRNTLLITRTTVLCGPAEVELLLQGGRAAEAVGLDLHGAVVEVCRLGAVGEGDCEVDAEAVGVAVGVVGDGDGHVGGGGGGEGGCGGEEGC